MAWLVERPHALGLPHAPARRHGRRGILGLHQVSCKGLLQPKCWSQVPIGGTCEASASLCAWRCVRKGNGALLR